MSQVRTVGAVMALALLSCAAVSGQTSAQDIDAQALALYGPGVPSTCSAKPARAQKYQAGLSKGTHRADELFASSEIGRNQQKLQKKIHRVLERLHDQVREAWRSDSSDVRRCRVQGVVNGFLSRIVAMRSARLTSAGLFN